MLALLEVLIMLANESIIDVVVPKFHTALLHRGSRHLHVGFARMMLVVCGRVVGVVQRITHLKIVFLKSWVILLVCLSHWLVFINLFILGCVVELMVAHLEMRFPEFYACPFTDSVREGLVVRPVVFKLLFGLRRVL